MKAAQAATVELATRSGLPYIDKDFKVLADPQLTQIDKALTLGRTYAAISNMCGKNGYSSLGHSLGSATSSAWSIDNPNADRIDEITESLKQEFATTGVPFPAWDWDDEDLKETA